MTAEVKLANPALATTADHYLSNEEIVIAARRNLPDSVWNYLVGGSESETTLRRNRLAFDRLAFRPRVLRDVSKIDTSTTLLGQKLRIPAVLAPVGALETFTPNGAAASAQAAEAFGILQVVSSATEPPLEATAAATEQNKVFQLYIRGDDAWMQEMVRRIKAAGYIGFTLTVDIAVYSRRERAMLSGFTPPAARARVAGVSQNISWGALVDWDMLDHIREATGDLPFLLKGVQTVEDALTAVEHGVNVIWVSNHGGRQLDHGLGTMDYLRDIVQAVAGRAEIIVDGGVQRGGDIVKALCLGANAVALGKLQGWGLAAAGAPGVRRMLEILENEMISTMGLMGVTTVAQLGPQYLARAEAVTTPHEMSAWVNMPKSSGVGADGRIR